MSRSTRSKTMTDKALAANRANAKKSTGPRTPQGKSRSRWNALKHGILANAIIPPSLERYEDPSEFRELLAALQGEYGPVGVVETLLVETVASCYWRLGRLHRAEGAAISQAHERAGSENEKRAHLLAEVQRDSAAIEQALATGDPDALQRVLDPEGIYPSCQGRGALAMAADQLRRIRTDLSDEDVKDPQSACDRASLPDTREALLFARYEAHLQRQLYRALSTLRRLQRDRNRADPRPSEPDPDPAPVVPAPAPPASANDAIAAAGPSHPAPPSRGPLVARAPAASPGAAAAPRPPAIQAPGAGLRKSKRAKRKSAKRTHPPAVDRRPRPRLTPLVAAGRRSRGQT